MIDSWCRCLPGWRGQRCLPALAVSPELAGAVCGSGLVFAVDLGVQAEPVFFGCHLGRVTALWLSLLASTGAPALCGWGGEGGAFTPVLSFILQFVLIWAFCIIFF